MTSANTKWIIFVVATLCGGLATAHLRSSHGSRANSQKKDRARVVISQPLPKLAGDHLKASWWKFTAARARRRRHIRIPAR